MKSFTLGEFVAFTGALALKIEHHKHEAMEKAAVIVETEAKHVLGTHEYGWPPLKPETIARKANGDTPLLETGEMRDSISHEVHGDTARVGSSSDKALWHELGTSKIPPRPFLQGAVHHKIDEVCAAIGHHVVKVMTS